jgi:hypothetical protein
VCSNNVVVRGQITMFVREESRHAGTTTGLLRASYLGCPVQVLPVDERAEHARRERLEALALRGIVRTDRLDQLSGRARAREGRWGMQCERQGGACYPHAPACYPCGCDRSPHGAITRGRTCVACLTFPLLTMKPSTNDRS